MPFLTCPLCAAETVAIYGDRPKVDGPEAAAELLTPLLGSRDRECCVTLNLDTKNRLIGVAVVSVGTLMSTYMRPREVYRDALLVNAAAIMVAHNHPSGDATPSPTDITITGLLKHSGQMIGVDLLDHIVIGESWVSMAREKLV